MDRTCLDCDELVSARRRRCPDCRSKAHAQWKREKRAAESGAESGPSERGPVIDYMRGGGPPPQFAGIGRPPAPKRRDPGEISDGRVPHPSERVYRPDASQLTNAQRRDRYQVEREMVREQLAAEAEENDTVSWDSLQAANERMANTVSFARSPVDAGGLRGSRPQYAVTNPAAAGMAFGPMPDYMAAAAGQSIRGVQPRQDRGPQKTPNIIIN
jgi:hypothetical protein